MTKRRRKGLTWGIVLLSYSTWPWIYAYTGHSFAFIPAAIVTGLGIFLIINSRKPKFAEKKITETVRTVGENTTIKRTSWESRLCNCINKYWPGSTPVETEHSLSESEREVVSRGVIAKIRVASNNIDEACLVEASKADTVNIGYGYYQEETRLSTYYYVAYRMRVPKQLAIFKAKSRGGRWKGHILAKVLNSDKALNKLLKSVFGAANVEVNGVDIRVYSSLSCGCTEPSRDLLNAIDIIAGHVRHLSKVLEKLPRANDETDVPDRYWNNI